MKRVFIIMLDSLGIGSARDADKFGDQGANTLGHIAQYCAANQANSTDLSIRQGRLKLPHLETLGLGLAAEKSCGVLPDGFQAAPELIGGYAFAQQISSSKDTISGHWEIAGVPVFLKWNVFPQAEQSFPEDLLERIVQKAGLAGYLGNCHGTSATILDTFGEEHIKTGYPIFYTSEESVFQIACHEQHYGLEKLYELCQIVREELALDNIGRVIARPFVGEKTGEFQRTTNRRDFTVEPPTKTLLQKLIDEKQGIVVAVGNVADIYAHTGISKKIKATGLEELFDKTLQEMRSAGENTLVFANFVNFDATVGYHRDVTDYAIGLEYFDRRLPELLELVNNEDLLILTTDHGCDPTWQESIHTREHIPVLLYGSSIPKAFLGQRETFADIAQTVAQYFDLSPMDYGKSIL
ncbi:phosphopentomutase [Lonepinella sp. BR2271]|uniref:phosphopentomutase n=1 Tax=Lonepinella sp. BR2271 TaxID=3434550 RepID=UPI003F6E3D20